MFLYLYNHEKSLKKSIKGCIKASERASSEFLLKKALRKYNEEIQLGLRNEQIDNLILERGSHGKPYFPELIDGTNGRTPVFFSISHSGDWWACMIGNVSVGLDIEDLKRLEIRNNQLKVLETNQQENHIINNNLQKKSLRKNKVNYQAIAKRFFTENEYEYVKKYGEDGFFELWVRKEAYIKMKGTGMSEGLASFELLKDCKLVDYIKGAYFTKIELNSAIKAVYCLEEQSKIMNIKELFLNES